MAKRGKRAVDSACAIYARFSSDKQRNESIEDQIAACEEYAEAHGYKVVATYADYAKSGTREDRPQFQLMIAESGEGMWSKLLVYKLDRFARDRFAASVYRRRLEENGVSLVSAMESIPDTPEGSILESVIEGFNEYYSRNLSQNVSRGMNGNARRCMANGVSVYGYDVGEDGRYIINEKEAANVRAIFNLAATRATRREMLEWMDERGIRNSRGNKYNYNSLRLLLSCEKYVGVYMFGDVRIENGMPQIIERDLFDRVQLSQRTRPRVNAFPLSGILFDDETGLPYHGTSGTGCSGKSYLYYACKLENGTVRYNKDDVEQAVEEVISKAFSERSVAEAIANAALQLISERFDGAELREAEERLKAARNRRERLLDAIEDGVPAADVKPRLEEAKAEIEKLTRKCVSLAHPDIPSREWIVEWVCTELGREMTKSDIRRTIDKATIDEQGILRVSIPWLAGLPIETEKSGEHAGSSMFAAVTDGRPDSSPCELFVSRSHILLRSHQRLEICDRRAAKS